VGHANIENSQSKFSGTSAEFDGTGDGLTIPDNAVFDSIWDGGNDFTVDFWMRASSLATDRAIMNQYADTSNHLLIAIGSVNTEIVATLKGSGGTSFDAGTLQTSGAGISINLVVQLKYL
jgi:hypothetical protein